MSAGLGLQLYDQTYATDLHQVSKDWIQLANREYVHYSDDDPNSLNGREAFLPLAL